MNNRLNECQWGIVSVTKHCRRKSQNPQSPTGKWFRHPQSPPVHIYVLLAKVWAHSSPCVLFCVNAYWWRGYTYMMEWCGLSPKQCFPSAVHAYPSRTWNLYVLTTELKCLGRPAPGFRWMTWPPKQVFWNLLVTVLAYAPISEILIDCPPFTIHALWNEEP